MTPGSSGLGAEMSTPGIGPATEGLRGLALLVDSQATPRTARANSATYACGSEPSSRTPRKIRQCTGRGDLPVQLCVSTDRTERFRDGGDAAQERWGAKRLSRDGRGRSRAPDDGPANPRCQGYSYLFANSGRGRLDSHTCFTIMPGTVASVGAAASDGAAHPRHVRVRIVDAVVVLAEVVDDRPAGAALADEHVEAVVTPGGRPEVPPGRPGSSPGCARRRRYLPATRW